MRTRVLASAAMFLMVTMVSAPWLCSESDLAVPHFNDGPPSRGKILAPILTKDQLYGPQAQYAYQIHAYELAAKFPKIIYQQPCYCYCDRGMGHTSLHSCFSGTHGAMCSTCLKELYYAYSMNKQHKTARQIRAAIIRGEWKQIDLATAASIN